MSNTESSDWQNFVVPDLQVDGFSNTVGVSKDGRVTRTWVTHTPKEPTVSPNVSFAGVRAEAGVDLQGFVTEETITPLGGRMICYMAIRDEA